LINSIKPKLHINKKALQMQGFLCDRARIRTWDLLIRSELLYPTELRNHYFNNIEVLTSFVGVAGFEPATSCSQSRRDDRATLHPEVQKNKRRVRDSNPWYSFPYACLANKSFRPLRQLSNLLIKNLSFKRLQMYVFLLVFASLF
jgi:hypothetical protein